MNGLKIIRSSLYYIIILGLVLFIVTNISGRVESIYKLTKVCSYTVLTGSMKPGINPGDIVMVKAVSIDEIESGDIVTFYKDGDIITHRAIKNDREGILTKGDNNNVLDNGQVISEDFIGKVNFVIPKLGYLLNPPYNMLAISIIMLLGGAYIIIKVFANRSKAY